MATGSPVSSLLDLDEEMLLTIEQAHADRFSRTEELLATVCDLLAQVVHVSHASFIAANHKNAKEDLRRLTPPEPFPRPGQPHRKRRRGSTLAEVAAVSRPKYVPGGGD